MFYNILITNNWFKKVLVQKTLSCRQFNRHRLTKNGKNIFPKRIGVFDKYYYGIHVTPHWSRHLFIADTEALLRSPLHIE